MKKNTKITFSKSFSILAAAALSMTLIGGQAFPAYAESTSGIESGAVIPDNITINSPTALSNVALPSNAYGTLSWADGSYVPEKRVQSCEVVFKPSAGAELSGLPGWDSNSGTLTGYVTVVVSSIDSTAEDANRTDDSTDSEEGYASDSSEESSAKASEDSSTEETDSSDTGLEDSSEKETSDEEDASNADDASKEENTDQNGSEIDSENKEDTKDSDASSDSTDESQTDKITGTPEAPSEDTETSKQDDSENEQPQVTETPEATETPSADEDSSTEEPEDKKDETPEITEAPETTETPEVTETPEDNNDNIFDREEEEEDKRPQNAATDLTDTEKEQTAVQNHTCDGITVSGIDLPWYVQFRVSGGDDYEFTNEEDATIFKSYEFELWDTQNNTEYKIPDGEYISVTVPVKAGYTYSIEHILDNGAMETIIPSVDGDTMTFSTHSFSPFGIAGSKSLVGPDAGDDASVTVTPAADTSSTDTSQSTSATDAADSADTDLDDSTAQTVDSTEKESTSSDNNSTSDNESEEETSQATSKKQVNTGDTTQILPFVILFVAAAVVAGVAVFIKRRKK